MPPGEHDRCTPVWISQTASRCYPSWIEVPRHDKGPDCHSKTGAAVPAGSPVAAPRVVANCNVLDCVRPAIRTSLLWPSSRITLVGREEGEQADGDGLADRGDSEDFGAGSAPAERGRGTDALPAAVIGTNVPAPLLPAGAGVVGRGKGEHAEPFRQHRSCTTLRGETPLSPSRRRRGGCSRC